MSEDQLYFTPSLIVWLVVLRYLMQTMEQFPLERVEHESKGMRFLITLYS